MMSYRVSLQINGNPSCRDFASAQEAKNHVESLEYRIKARVHTQYDAIGIFRIVNNKEARELFNNNEEVCELHDDGTESAIEDESIFENSKDSLFGICIGTDSGSIPFF